MDHLSEIDRHWSECLDTLSAEMGIERWRIEESFAYGACAALAIAVSEHRGLPLCIVGDEDGYSHAFCVVAPGYGLDIWGVRSLQEILAMWIDDDQELRIRSVSAEELRAMEGAAYLEDMFSNVPSRLAIEGCIAGAVYDEFTRTEFVCGACGDFAAVLHDLTGWPLRAGLDKQGDIEHVWVLNAEGRAVDVNGVHDTDLAATPYSVPSRDRTISISRSKVTSDDRWAKSNRHWASDLIKRYPEIFGLADAAPEP